MARDLFQEAGIAPGDAPTGRLVYDDESPSKQQPKPWEQDWSGKQGKPAPAYLSEAEVFGPGRSAPKYIDHSEVFGPGNGQQKPWDKNWWENDPLADAGAFADLVPAKGKVRTWGEAAADTGIDLAKGAVGLGESLIGLADLATGNLVGKGWSELGFDPARTKQMLSEGYSDARQNANRKVANAEGFMDTTMAMVTNPSAAVGSMVESAPLMLGGAGAVRAAATKMLASRGLVAGSAEAAAFLRSPATIARLTAISSAAEGAMTAGNIQEQARQAGRDYADTAPAAVAGGALTAAIGFGTSKIPGFKDAEVGAALAGMGNTQRQGLITAGKQIARGVIKEGVLEELPQSAQEQAFTNLALGKPWYEGVDEAAAQGMIAGAGMGGGMTSYSAGRDALSGRPRTAAPENAKNPPPALAKQGQAATNSGAVNTPKNQPVDVQAPAAPRPEVRLAELELTSENRSLTDAELSEAQSLVSALQVGSAATADTPQQFEDVPAFEAPAAAPAAAQQAASRADVPAQEGAENGPPAHVSIAPEAINSEVPAMPRPYWEGFQSGDRVQTPHGTTGTLKISDDKHLAYLVHDQNPDGTPNTDGGMFSVTPQEVAKIQQAAPAAPAMATMPRANFWAFAQAQGIAPGSLKVGSPEWQAVKNEYEAARAGMTPPASAAVATPPAPEPRIELQNRDRSRAASVVQMQDIAKNPDYMRLGTSRTPDSGAPMIFPVGDDGRNIPDTSLGHEDMAVMSDGQRVPFVYAVVTANQVNASNFSDGNLNPAYDSKDPGTLKALNNGRTAGLQAAYMRGKAEKYKAELLADVANHGVPAEVINRTLNPMLVRLYRDADNTPGMAAKSQGQGLSMAPGELARQDAPLLDATILTAYRPGDVTSAANRGFVRAFIGKLRHHGQDVAAMMTADGQLSPAGRTRIQAALVQAAYGDGDLVNEMFDSQDSDIKAIGTALKTVAGQWADMRDSARMGAIDAQVDITGNLVQAVNLIRKARQENTALAELAAQRDLLTGQSPDPITVGLLRFFYKGDAALSLALGTDKVVAKLNAYIQAAMGTSSGVGMFDDAVTVDRILGSINNEANHGQQTQNSGTGTGGGSHPGLDLDAGRQLGNSASGPGAGGIGAAARAVEEVTQRPDIEQAGSAPAPSNQEGGEGNAPGQKRARLGGEQNSEQVVSEQKQPPALVEKGPVATKDVATSAAEAAPPLAAGDAVSWQLANGKTANGVVVRAPDRQGGTTVRATGAQAGAGVKAGSVFSVPQEKLVTVPKAADVADAFAETTKKTSAQEPAKAAKIEDAGQKIGGARKDRWKERGLDLSDLEGMSESEGAELATKANVWKPDYAAMAEATEQLTAAMVKTVYDQLAAQPKKNTPEGRRNYVTMMQAVRQAYLGATTPEEVKAAGDKLKQDIGLYATDPAVKAKAREVLFSVYKGRSDPFVLSYNELAKAKKLVADGFPEKGEPWKKRLSVRAYGGQGMTPAGISLVLKESAELGTPLTTDQIVSGYHRISNKDGQAVGYAASKEDAEAAAKTVYERDLKSGPADKAEPARPHLDILKRDNLPQRIDRDVSADDFVKDFGFRGVEFGNWAAQDERQRILNMAYDGLRDLADIMGVPPKALSLNGSLGMAFGARGGGRFAAHYEPGKLVINMTKLQGGGSMSHEWAHGLDHYMGELNRPDAYTTAARGASGWYSEEQYKGVPVKRMEQVGKEWKTVEKTRLDNLRPELARAFDQVMSALFSGQETKAQMIRSLELQLERTQALAAKEIDPQTKAMYERMVQSQTINLEESRQEPEDKTYPKGRSEYAKQAQKLSGKSVNGYWTRPTEMFARAFESWVFDKVAAMGARSDYLVHGVEEDRFAGGQYKGNPYPTGEERATINAALDNLVKTIQIKETDKGVAMFSRTQTAGDAGPEHNALRALSQNDELFALPKSDKDTIEGIAADTDPGITVKPLNHPGLVQTYVLTMPNGARAKLMVRQTNPYGAQTYGMLDRDDVDMEVITDRPGENAESVPDDTEDVYIDVSELKEGGQGAKIYNIAATFAHNTGRILIGDPAGLSDEAMRRRTEHMLSSALKFGTTRHLAPHPRQTMGAFSIGVPPLRWTYGDDLGNIKSLIQTSLKALDHAGPLLLTFDLPTGTFRDSAGRVLDGNAIRSTVESGRRPEGGAGVTTHKRSAVLSALVREKGGKGSTGGQGAGILAQLMDVGREFSASSQGIFYSKGSAASRNGLTAQQITGIVDAIRARWANAPDVQVLASMDGAPAAVRKEYERQNSKGASGSTEGFFYGGKVYLVADQLASPTDAMRVLFHEALGHMGLRGVFGDNLKPILQQIIVARRSEVATKAKQYGLDMANPDDALAAAEEVLAGMAQDKPELGFVKRAIAAIRTWLRDNVPGFKDLALTDAEIINSYILPARAFVQLGQGGVDGALSFSRGIQTGTAAFKAWFGDSKVVGKDGKPLVVYHGTQANFSVFDAQATPVNGLRYARGFYMTAQPAYASMMSRETAGSNVMPVFASLKNPRVFGSVKEANALSYAQWSEIERVHDGVIIQDDGVMSEVIAFRSEQIKSATGNNGDFDPANPDIRFNRNSLGNKPIPPVTGTQANAWTMAKAKVMKLTSPEVIDKLIYEFQDKFTDLKNLRAHIQELGGTITDLNDAYQGEELYHSRLAKRTADFLDKELKPLLADMRSRGVSKEQLENYLHARHAPEANAAMAERNPTRQMIDDGRAKATKDVKALELKLQHARNNHSATKAIEDALTEARGELAKWHGAQAFKGTEEARTSLSGMSDLDAKAYMDSLTPRQLENLKELATSVDAIQAETLDTLARYGLMDRASLSAWRKAYQHYVPLHRDEARPETGSHPIGQGYSVKGNASKQRTGSTEKVTNILAHIAMQREAALTRGEKNHVVKKLYLMAAQNPDKDFWEVDAPPMIKTIDSRTGFVRTMVDPQFKNLPNVVMVRIAGNDQAVVFNEHNKQAKRLAEAIKNIDVGDLHVVLGLAAKGTRWFASVNTQYNPIFGLVNFARDVQSGLLNLTTTPLAGKQKEVAANIPAAMRAIYRERRGKSAASVEWTRLWDEYQSVGGITGYKDMFADVEDRAKALTKELEALDRGEVSKAAHAVVDWLSDYNEAMENSVRLAAYKQALDQGISKERAASLAKNLTVNFNRKGRQAREIGALYAFFNASIQGTARMAETLKGPVGKRIMYGGVLLGVVNTLIGMAVMGGDDDDAWEQIPEFIKERSIVIPIGHQDYLTIPMPLGFHVFPNIGRIATEFALGGQDKTAGRQLGKLLMATLDSFNPLGGSQNLGQLVSPTVIDPVVALMENKDGTGRPIYRENANGLDPQPGHTMAKDSASSPSRFIAKQVNRITGGTEYRPGAWSPTPDQLDYVIGQLTGGLGRELLKANQTVVAAATGDELPPYKVPLLGRLYGNTRGPSGQSGQYYANVKTLNEIENEVKGRLRNSEDAEGYQKSEPLSQLVQRGNVAERHISKIRKVRRMVVEKAEPGYQERVKELDKLIGETMADLNREVTKARRKAEEKP